MARSTRAINAVGVRSCKAGLLTRAPLVPPECGHHMEHSYDIFVSYASQEADIVRSIVHELHYVGVTSFWWDSLSIKPADSIPQSIDDGIRRSKCLLAIIGTAYFSKPWTQAELNAIRVIERPVIPVWIDVTQEAVREFSPTLASIRAIHYDDCPDYVAHQVAELLRKDPESHFAKAQPRREELTAFRGLVYLYVHAVLGTLDDKARRQMDNTYNRNRVPGTKTWRKHIEAELHLSPGQIRSMRDELPPLSDTDTALSITAIIKRSGNVWFPTYSNELEALRRAGFETW